MWHNQLISQENMTKKKKEAGQLRKKLKKGGGNQYSGTSS